jgi:hypothetical protein
MALSARRAAGASMRAAAIVAHAHPQANRSKTCRSGRVRKKYLRDPKPADRIRPSSGS